MTEKKQTSRSLMIPPRGGFLRDLIMRIKLILRLMGDRRVNFFIKLLPIAALAYLFSPVDLAPGIVLPVIGALDDAAILWLGMYLFVELCPPDVVQVHMKKLTRNLEILKGQGKEEIVDADSVEISDEDTSRYEAGFVKCISVLVIALALTACGPIQTPPRLATVTKIPPTLTATTVPPTPIETPPPTSTHPVSVASFPDPESYAWRPVAAGFDRPVDIAHAGDASGRLFVVEKEGRIRIVQNGQMLETPFLNIVTQVGSRGSEQGLLGLAFHPHYTGNGFFFVNYTDMHGDTVIARFRVSSDPNRADPKSEVGLLYIGQPYANHNGGGLAFGPDGYLYIALGDGGSGGDPHGNGQSLNTLLGKILRVDVDSGEPYAIPPANPFANGGGWPEVWAYGLRNPWRISFDRLTGDLYIGDVGQNEWEEIDFLPAGNPGGANFGWNYREGSHRYGGEPPADIELIEPVAVYGHDQGCSVTGGAAYRGQELPEWAGVYFYGDFCSGQVWGLLRSGSVWDSRLLFETQARISTFGQDEAGEVYLADYASGTIYRLGRR